MQIYLHFFAKKIQHFQKVRIIDAKKKNPKVPFSVVLPGLVNCSRSNNRAPWGKEPPDSSRSSTKKEPKLFFSVVLPGLEPGFTA